MAEATFSLDLHVLGPPLTFALSQDQTLHRKFEPALRRAWCGSVRGTAPTRNVEWFRSQTRNPQSSNDLLSSFQRPIPSRIFPLPIGVAGVLPVWARRVRRGSVLIRGTGRTVNADRSFFLDPLALQPKLMFFQRLWELENSDRPLVPTP
jgi:hypothetical protein